MYIAQGPAGIRSDLYVIDYVGATIVSLRRVEFAEYGFGFAFSPDQQRIAYYVNEPAPTVDPKPENSPSLQALYVARADGSQPIRLSSFEQLHDQNRPAWSPDGSLIAYESAFPPVNQRPPGGPGIPSGHVWVVPSSGEGQAIDVSAGLISGSGPSWAPDSQRLTFTGMEQNSANPGVYVANADGSALKRLSPPDARESGATWSPGDGLIAYWTQEGGGRLPAGEFHTMTLDGTGRRNITNHPSNDFTIGQGSPPIAWSPDGQYIAFLSDRDEPAESEIYVMRYDGADVVRLTNRPGYEWMPWWSRDRFCLTYRAGNQILIVGADGRRTEVLYNLLWP
jgi:Tol biopolymer transport system component